MFKKSLITILSATLLAAMIFTTVFAAAPNEEEIGIAPYDSNLLVDAQEDVWEYLYTLDTPLLIPNRVQVTSHFTNPDSITIQQFTPAGSATGSAITLAPGTSGTITVMPDFSDDSVDLRVLVATSGVYRIGLSEDNLNEDLYSVELNDNSWVNLLNISIESLTDFNFVVTNTTFSPDDINVRVIQDGVEGAIQLVEVGRAENIPVNGSPVEQDILLQVQAASSNFGTYHVGASVLE